MTFMEQRIERAVESILENENLTTDLNDEAAQFLLDWGIKCAREIAIGTAEFLDDEQAEEIMYQPMRALRRMLRTINKWYAKIQTFDRGYGPNALESILELAAIVYGSKYQKISNETSYVILSRQDEFRNSPVAFLAYLRSSIETPPQKQ